MNSIGTPKIVLIIVIVVAIFLQGIAFQSSKWTMLNNQPGNISNVSIGIHKTCKDDDCSSKIVNKTVYILNIIGLILTTLSILFLTGIDMSIIITGKYQPHLSKNSSNADITATKIKITSSLIILGSILSFTASIIWAADKNINIKGSKLGYAWYLNIIGSVMTMIIAFVLLLSTNVYTIYF